MQLHWNVATIDPDLDLAIIDKSTGQSVGTNSTWLWDNNTRHAEEVRFTTPAMSYGQSKTYQVRVTAKTVGSDFTLQGQYPVWDKPAKLELVDSSGTAVASMVPPTSGTASATVSYPSGTAQTYAVRATSGGQRSTGSVTGAYQHTAWATVSAQLKDSGGGVFASTSGSAGSLSMTATLPSSGTYSVVLTDSSSDLSVPSYSLTATRPKQHTGGSGSVSLALKNASGAVVATGTSANPSTLSAAATRGAYTLVVTPVSGSGTAQLTASYPGGASETIAYDGKDHATSIDDGLAKVTETLSPSGRVLERKVVDDVTLAVKEDTIFGYDGNGDSPAYSRPAGGGAVTTYVRHLGALLLTDTGGVAAWTVVNGHGDVVGTTDSAGTFTPNPTTDEFGAGDGPSSRLGCWAPTSGFPRAAPSASSGWAPGCMTPTSAGSSKRTR
jgi:hypothetical protein